MDLQPLEDEAPLHRDVALLLKCAKSVNWVIKAHGVIGRLDVVVSWQHDSRQKLPTQKNILFFFFLTFTDFATEILYSLITHHSGLQVMSQTEMSSLCTSDQRICHTGMCVELAPGPLCRRGWG